MLIKAGCAIQRELGVVVFGVLISVYGAMRLFASSRPLVRAAAAVLVIAMPVQFAYFANDSFTGYRFRAAKWLDPINAFEDRQGGHCARRGRRCLARLPERVAR